MALFKYPQSISEAAADLDKVIPNWEEKISLESLNMLNCTKCILGQLFGHYDDGMNQLFEEDQYTLEELYKDNIFGCDADIEDWKREIEARLPKEN
jgi:hypothetical protein